MLLSCPACGAGFSLDVLIAHDGAREALTEAMGLNPAFGRRLLAYLGLFRSPNRHLSMDRVAKILREIGPDIKAARITRHGRDWAVPMESWTWALDEIVSKKEKLTLPLKNHAYLYQMLVSTVDRAEGIKEEAQETRRKGGGLATGEAAVVRSSMPTAVAVEQVVKASQNPDVARAALEAARMNLKSTNRKGD